jgi:hypothetical protein
VRLPAAPVILAVLSLLPTARLGAQQRRPAPPAADSALVVFVCEHGSVKSLVAATLFNRMAAERQLAARAISRGTVPDSVVPPVVRDGLRGAGADVGAVRPRGLGPGDARGASLFVAFDVDVPTRVAGPIPVRRWDGTPSVMRGYAVGRDSIAARVAALVSEVARARDDRRPLRP